VDLKVKRKSEGCAEKGILTNGGAGLREGRSRRGPKDSGSGLDG